MNNKVILLGFYGSDQSHALSAWCSTYKEVHAEMPEFIHDRLDHLFQHTQKVKKREYYNLLRDLAKDGHHTPFEKSCLHFLVTTDIASHIHLIKHRIGVSVNSESARYKELVEDKYYTPVDWDDEEQNLLTQHSKLCYQKYHDCIDRLMSKGVTRKRAKESARFYLPYNMQYTADVTFNFRSFMHFQELRNSEHAQLEIRMISNTMLNLIENIPGSPFQYSLGAFGFKSDPTLLLFGEDENGEPVYVDAD